MKVTKLIREYITEEVSKVYNAKVNPYSEQAKADKQIIENFKQELLTRQQEVLDKFVAENNFQSSWDNTKPLKISATIPGFHYVVSVAMVNEEKWNKENQRAKNAKIRDIILSLELGANRQELNAMIANLMNEV